MGAQQTARVGEKTGDLHPEPPPRPARQFVLKFETVNRGEVDLDQSPLLDQVSPRERRAIVYLLVRDVFVELVDARDGVFFADPVPVERCDARLLARFGFRYAVTAFGSPPVAQMISAVARPRWKSANAVAEARRIAAAGTSSATISS